MNIQLLYARRRRAQQAQVGERTLYHGTDPERLKSILSIGLVPSAGPNTLDVEGGDPDAKICLTHDKGLARSYGDRVLQVDTDDLPGHRFVKDKYEKSSVVTHTRIPPETLSVVESTLLLSETRSQITADALLKARGYRTVPSTSVSAGKLGHVTRYSHPDTGHQVILTKRLAQGRDRVTFENDPGQWDLAWHHYGTSGQTERGHTVRGLYDHLSKIHA